MSELETRQRGKKLSSNKLSALERLKKARQGEKIDDDDDEENEEFYEEVDDDDYEEDEIANYKSSSSKKKSSSLSNKNKKKYDDDDEEEAEEEQLKKPRKNMTRSKLTKSTSAYKENVEIDNDGGDGDESEVVVEKKKSNVTDIRTAFFKASTAVNAQKPKQQLQQQEKKQPTIMKTKKNRDDDAMDDGDDDCDGGDDIMNEIMKELKSQTTNANAKQPKRPQQCENHAITLSPAHKRKLSPTSNTSAAAKNRQSLSYDKESKKIELDQDLMEQLFNSEQQQDPTIVCKSEPIEMLKSEPIEFDDDLKLLSNLSLDSLKSSSNHHQQQQFTVPSVKLEPLNDSTVTTTIKSEEVDLQSHVKNQANSDRLLFYWYDAHEDTASGIVYMFGKVPISQKKESNELSFVSVCCIVRNIPHVVYFLPRTPASMNEMRDEVEALMKRQKVSSYKMRQVKKHNSFDRRIPSTSSYEPVDIPFESEYLELEYQSVKSLIAHDLQGKHFAAVFGAQSTYAEQLIVDLKLKGPCWLLASNAKSKDPGAVGAMVSWCKLEYVVDNYRHISVYRDGVTLDKPAVPLPATPPMTALTLIIRTMLNPKTQEHEIVCVSGLVTSKFHLEKGCCSAAASGDANKSNQTKSQHQQLFDQRFCALGRPSTLAFPYDVNTIKANTQNYFHVEICNSERQLLTFLLTKIFSLDADLIIGHDLFGFNFEILLNRCHVNKVPHWSRFGRLKRNTMPQMPHGSKFHHTFSQNIQQRIMTVCAGRLMCDIMLSAKELLTKCKSFDLTDLVAQVLLKKDMSTASMIEQQQQQRDYEKEKQVSMFFNDSQLLTKFIQLSLVDAANILKICNEIQALQLAYQITCITGMILSRTLTGGRSERNEYLLLHAFYDKDFILPDKFVPSYSKYANNKAANKTIVKKEPQNETQMMETNETTQIGDGEDAGGDEKKDVKAAPHHSNNGYQGGLVLEPKVGFYDRFILLLDFNSLYPSIIQEYNICFTTISRPNLELAERDIDEYLETCIKLPGADEKPGILPTEIRKLVDSRRQVKQLLQDKNLSADLRMQYDIRQKALKLTANSVYGCLGFENSRFYCKPLAALITKFGRNILMKTKELVESKKIEVIYGDTDSIMINTNLSDFDLVFKLGNSLKSEVNKLYKHLEIDIDGVFKALLLLRKKKYAALVAARDPKDPSALVYTKELKGLDVIRRDWSPLAKEIGERVVNEILSGQACDTVLTNINKILDETAEKLKANSFDLSLFEISKQLNRNPEDYNDSNHQPHVLVALRHNQDVNNSKKFKSGDVVSYIICEDGTSNSATQRAYSKSELLKNKDSKLTLDINYYLRQQIHPVVTRLCDPIEGIDAPHIAQLLGLDPTGFRHKSSNGGGGGDNMAISMPTLSKQQKKLESFMNELERYSNCVPFKYTCPGCKTDNYWQAPCTKTTQPVKVETGGVKMEQDGEMDDDDEDFGDIQIDESTIKVTNKKPTTTTQQQHQQKSNQTTTMATTFKPVLDACSNEQCKMRPASRLAYIKNCLTIQLNKFIRQYYQAWLTCEDSMCSCRTKRISSKFSKGQPQCIECDRASAHLEYSHSDLYYQMKYFKFIFDLDAFRSLNKNDQNELNNVLRSKDLTASYNQLREFVNKRLKLNAYGIANLNDLFKSIL